MQDSVLRPGSIPGTPITGVFVAVRHRSVTNNNNFKKSLFNLVFSIGHQCVVKEPQQWAVATTRLPLISRDRKRGEPDGCIKKCKT